LFRQNNSSTDCFVISASLSREKKWVCVWMTKWVSSFSFAHLTHTLWPPRSWSRCCWVRLIGYSTRSDLRIIQASITRRKLTFSPVIYLVVCWLSQYHHRKLGQHVQLLLSFLLSRVRLTRFICKKVFLNHRHWWPRSILFIGHGVKLIIFYSTPKNCWEEKRGIVSPLDRPMAEPLWWVTATPQRTMHNIGLLQPILGCLFFVFYFFSPIFIFWPADRVYTGRRRRRGVGSVCLYIFHRRCRWRRCATARRDFFSRRFFSLLSAFIFLYNCTTTPTFSSQYDLTLCSRFLLLLPQQLRVPRGRENIFIFSLSLIHLEGMYNDFIETFIKHFI
jgi:hypothetical protein